MRGFAVGPLLLSQHHCFSDLAILPASPSPPFCSRVPSRSFQLRSKFKCLTKLHHCRAFVGYSTSVASFLHSRRCTVQELTPPFFHDMQALCRLPPTLSLDISWSQHTVLCEVPMAVELSREREYRHGPLGRAQPLDLWSISKFLGLQGWMRTSGGRDL